MLRCSRVVSAVTSACVARARIAATLLAAPLLAAGTGGAAPAARVESATGENGTVETTLRWGSYRVKYLEYANDRLADVVQIRDERDQVQVEIRDERFAVPRPDQVGEHLRDLNGDGVPELRILAWSGGAYCCYVEYLFDRSAGRLRNLLIWNGGEFNLDKRSPDFEREGGALRSPRHFSGSRLRDYPSLILENDRIQHVNDSTHGPTVVLVLDWDGTRYVDATRAHPELPRERALEYRAAVLCPSEAEIDLIQADRLAGYYANAVVAGDEAEARAWLAACRNPHIDAWLIEHAARIQAGLRGTQCTIGQGVRRLQYAPHGGAVPGSPCGA